MKKVFKVVGALVAILVLLFSAVSLFIGTLDADKYRPQIIDAIQKQTGRSIKLNGPILFSLRPSGIHISIQDASIGNLPGASRANMAGMGKFEIVVALFPLISHHVSVKALSIENADILLETNAAGQHNWDFVNAPKTPVTVAPLGHSAPPATSSVSIAKLTIVNSQLAMRSAEGQVSSYNVASLVLDMNGKGADVKFVGDINGSPINLTVKSGMLDLLSKDAFPFEADATYNAYHLTAKGKSDIEKGLADISEYNLSAGKSSLKGTLAVTWKGVRPTVNGTLTSDHLDPSDFKSQDDTETPTTSASQDKSNGKKEPSSGKLFSDTPLPLGSLKSADAQLTVTIADLPLGQGNLKNVVAKVVLSNGSLDVAPIRATVGSQTIDAQFKLDTSQSSAHLTVGIIGNGVDLSDLQKLANARPFMTGKASANIQVTGDGKSMHEIVSSLGGILTVTAEQGEILGGAASGISSALGAIFNPKGGNSALNCLAARFIAKGGMLTDNGVLIDSTPSTVSAKGTINLGAETINLVLHAKTKLVDIGGLVPAVDVNGTLEQPGYSIDATSTLTSLVGSLAKGNIDIVASSVPSIQTAPAGQNACVYTLDHPQAASSSGVLPADAVGRASQTFQNLGGSALKGLFGK